jgi:hypothetical protein
MELLNVVLSPSKEFKIGQKNYIWLKSDHETDSTKHSNSVDFFYYGLQNEENPTSDAEMDVP